MANPTPRVQIPVSIAKGDVFPVRTLINHRMETGLRHDSDGAVIPRDIINKLTCHFDDALVFSADLREAVAASPYIEFYLRATRSGRMTIVWRADDGAVYTLDQEIMVR